MLAYCFHFVQPMHVVWYIPHGPSISWAVWPQIPIGIYLVKKILLFLLFLILIIPLLKEQSDPEVEKKRRATLRIAVVLVGLWGLLSFVIHLFS